MELAPNTPLNHLNSEKALQGIQDTSIKRMTQKCCS